MLLTRNGQSDIDQDVLERLVRAGGACAGLVYLSSH